MNILAIGACSDIKNNKFTGQSVMFDGIVSELRKEGATVTVIDIAPNETSNIIFRVLDYIIVVIKEIFFLITRRYNLGYITTAQSKKGFIRDYVLIRILTLFKVTVICHQYGANYKQLIDALGKKHLHFLKNMLGRVSKVIVEGDHMKSQFDFLEGYEEKIVIVPNGLPTIGENALRAKSYSPESPFKIFYLSNLIWTKGYFDLLKAVDLLINKLNVNVKCTFAGAFMSSVDDPTPGVSNKTAFDKYIVEHNLGAYVRYFPGLYGREKDAVFDESNVFVLPTYYINEGQPVSVIEAMSYGCVPIVTNYRHIPMMVNTNNGVFVEAVNPESLAKAIQYLVDNPEAYHDLSRQSIEDFKEKFSFDRFTSQVFSCMQTLLQEKE